MVKAFFTLPYSDLKKLVGATWVLARILTERIRRHNASDSKETKSGLPCVLVHIDTFSARSEAARREQYYKTGRGRDELDKLGRAVAAATGRGFKSYQPDVNY